jgi:serine O-acetyltransferase
MRFNRLGVKLGFSIGVDVFGYGLVIPHYGTIVVGDNNRCGNYCVLHTSTCITGNGKTIGNAFYLATGAKVTSKISIGDNVSVGANSVVNKSFDSNMMIAGAPAYYIKPMDAWYIRDGQDYTHKVEAVELLRRKMQL